MGETYVEMQLANLTRMQEETLAIATRTEHKVNRLIEIEERRLDRLAGMTEITTADVKMNLSKGARYKKMNYSTFWHALERGDYPFHKYKNGRKYVTKAELDQPPLTAANGRAA